MYDIVFISYKEPNAEDNWKILKSKNKVAKRLHGVNGIHQAHVAAAKMVTTDMFYVVDGDATVLDDFKFDYMVSDNDIIGKQTVYVWRSKNPVNGLIYGYGGIKLLPRKSTLKMNIKKLDMTTSISKFYKPIPIISNITSFNTDPYNAWKGAFRECAKLSGKIIDRQEDNETIERLNIWCNVGETAPYGEYVIQGAKDGKDFGKTFPNKMYMINNFEWLEKQFKERYDSLG